MKPENYTEEDIQDLLLSGQWNEAELPLEVKTKLKDYQYLFDSMKLIDTPALKSYTEYKIMNKIASYVHITPIPNKLKIVIIILTLFFLSTIYYLNLVDTMLISIVFCLLIAFIVFIYIEIQKYYLITLKI